MEGLDVDEETSMSQLPVEPLESAQSFPLMLTSARTTSVPVRAFATCAPDALTDELVMVDSPTEMNEFLPSMTWSLLEPCWKSALAMVAVFFEVELEQELLNDSKVGSSMVMVQPQPAMVKEPMSKLSIDKRLFTIALAVIEMSPAVMSVNSLGWDRWMVMSPAVTVFNTESSPDGPLPVCDQPPGMIHKSAEPKSTSIIFKLLMALIPEFA